MTKQIEELKNALNKPKQINEILEEQIETALREHNRSNQDLFLSAISAGLEVGFSVFLMAVIFSLFNGVIHPSFLQVFIALAYPLVIGRSELFTEHTTLAVIPVLNRNATIKSLLVLWGIVYAGNLLGGYIFGYILSVLPERLNSIDNGVFSFDSGHLLFLPIYFPEPFLFQEFVCPAKMVVTKKSPAGR
jgi:formate-nitrite transporter family protein